jgi:hypothetical protein
MAVIFPILSTFDPRGVNSAQKAFKGLGGVSKTATVAFAALGAATLKFGTDAVKAAASDQAAQLKLAKTLQNVTQATAAQTAAVEKFITTQQFATGVSDTQLRPALETLVRATGDVTKAQGLLKIGLDVSAGSGRDLESISLALAKAQGGQFTALQRLGIVIPENIKKSKDFAKVQEYLNTLFGGQAAVAADTFEGKLRILRERLGEAQETIGAKLIPVLTNLVDAFLNNVMPAIERVANGGLKGLKTEIANTISGLTGMAAVIKNVVLALVGMKIAAIALVVAPPIIAAITTSLTAMRIAALYGAAGFKVLGVAIQTSLASTGVGLLIVGLGLVIGKLIEMKLTAGETDKTIRFMESNGVQAFRNMGNEAYIANQKIAGNIITLNAVALAASRAADEQENAGIKRVKLGRVPPVAVKVPDALDGVSSKSAPKAAAAMTNVSDTIKKAQANFEKLSDELTVAKDNFSSLGAELVTQNDNLKNAVDAYKSFKDSIKNVITGILDFGSAAKAETGSFVENLVSQAGKAADFASKVKQLITMGLSESALAQVLASGADAGTKIADEIIAGGATVVTQVNTLVSATDEVAKQLADAMPAEFYKAGITAGESLVQGVKDAIAGAAITVATAEAAVTNAATVVNQESVNFVNATLAKFKKSGKGLSKSEKQNITDLATQLNIPIPAMAKGGIVTGPTLALIGEAGPEAVIPLSGRNGGMGTTINLTVNAGMGADGASIGREIVDIIKRYERVSGPVFASA